MGFLDLDVNKAQNLHERLCINNDEFDVKAAFPSTPDITITNAATNCAGQASQSGSVTLESQGIGFLCDNPTSLTDLAAVTCADCVTQFSAAQCAKQTVADYFPINRINRVATVGFADRSRFTVSFGVNCEKKLGETCNRNFLFTPLKHKCKDRKAPVTAAPPMTTTAAPPATTAAPMTTQAPVDTAFVLYIEGKQCPHLDSLGYLPSTSGKKDSQRACLTSCLKNAACNAIIYYKRSRWCSNFKKMCSYPSKTAKNSVTYVTKTLLNSLLNG
jgi:hypothetical protein